MDLASLIVSLASHNADPSTTPDEEEAPALTTTVIGRNIHETGEVAAPPTTAPKPCAPSLPAAGTLDAKAFMKAVRWAKTRDEIIAAIAGYVGYDNRRDFGSQDQAAKAKAQRELAGNKVVGGPTRSEERTAARSLQGFVAGMPHPAQRILLNLQARERAAAEAMIDAKTPQEREAQRKILAQVRQAIEQL